ncbi:zinc finger BED domain-containing protein RICESLEEPER 2-like [Diospyros lotus]|uniref:zinc finger BED domain-containing protein RICESLEEPER 2-like n=1 Tax=Diospyros lotus TaxID=55363 RepID=UPI002251512E|nr:zinc finger BED domain-containing protein RICESLEEPER 2-like [Diospyros lotus]
MLDLGTNSWNNDLQQVITIDGRPKPEDWTRVRMFVRVLQQFYELTLRVSSTSYVTSNTFFHEISTVHCLLHEQQEGDDLELSEMVGKMKEKFDKYWGDPEKINHLLYIAVVLNPRHKLEFMEYALQEMYPGEKGVGAVLSLKNAAYALYEEYKKKLAPQGEVGERSQVSTPPVVENVEKGKSVRPNLLSSRFKKYKYASGSGSTTMPSEWDKYLSEVCEEETDDFDILNWWKVNCHRFPILFSMARDVLAIPVSTVASESAFSTGGRVLDPFRSSLSPKVVESLICTQD